MARRNAYRPSLHAVPVVAANGIELFYERWGQGPRLLLFNGSVSSIASSELLIKLFTNDFEVLVHDQRGLGRTQIPAGPYSMAQYAADAAALLDHVGWDRTRVVGISFGGMVAQEFAVTFPARVERLALLCTSPGGADGASYPLHELESLPAAEQMRLGTQLLDTRFTPEWLDAHPADRRLAEMLVARRRAEKSADARRGEAEQLAARSHHDVNDRLARRARHSSRAVASTGSRPPRTAKRSRDAYAVRGCASTKVAMHSSRRTPLRCPIS